MLKVSGLQLSHLSKSEHSDQVRKLLKHVTDVLRKIEEKHQVDFTMIGLANYWLYCSISDGRQSWGCLQSGADESENSSKGAPPQDLSAGPAEVRREGVGVFLAEVLLRAPQCQQATEHTGSSNQGREERRKIYSSQNKKFPSQEKFHQAFREIFPGSLLYWILNTVWCDGLMLPSYRVPELSWNLKYNLTPSAGAAELLDSLITF